MPEVAAAKASYESAQAQARLAAADAKRYENLVKTGDVSRSAFEKARTQQETADAQANAAKQQYEAAMNGARQSYGAVETSQASLESMRAQLAQAEKALADTTIRAPFDGYVSARPVAAGEHVARDRQDRDHRPHGHHEAAIADAGAAQRAREHRHDGGRAGLRVSRTAISRAKYRRSIPRSIRTLALHSGSEVSLIRKRSCGPECLRRRACFCRAREDAVFVPRAAVIHDRTTDSNQVFVIDNNVARLHVVLTGEAEGDSIRILSGLTGKETVATNHQSDLFDGAPVVVK